MRKPMVKPMAKSMVNKNGRRLIAVPLKRKANPSNAQRPSKRAHPQSRWRFTFFDPISAANGVLIVARSVGLEAFGVNDVSPTCAETLRLNFPDVKVYNLDDTEIHFWECIYTQTGCISRRRAAGDR